MTNQDRGNCPNCKRALIGAVEIIKTETEGIPTMLFQETPDRNWIQCDACNTIVCKQCCQNEPSGFCHDCWKRLQQSKISKTPIQSSQTNQSADQPRNQNTNQ